MDNVFEVSRFDTNTLLIGCDTQEYSVDEIRLMCEQLSRALPTIKVVVTPLVQGVYMIKEKI